VHKIPQPQDLWVLALVHYAVEGAVRYICFHMMDVLKTFDGFYA
jgi:hypothetical protein